MVDLPAGFRVVQPGQTPPEIPQGFRVVQPDAPTGPTISAGGRTLTIEEYRALPDAEREALRNQIARDNPSATMGPVAPQPTADEGAWRRGILAPIEKNTETGAFRPAVPQLALDAWNAVTLPGDVAAGNVPDLMPGTSFGNMSDETAQRAFDLSGMTTVGVPIGSRGVFSLNTPRPQTGPQLFGQGAPDNRIPQKVVNALRRDNITPESVGPRVEAMGPAAIAGDISPSMQSVTMGVAGTPGPGQSQMTSFLQQRANAARPRIQEGINEILGPSVSTGQFGRNIKDLRTATSPIYQMSFESARPVSTQPIITQLSNNIANTVGGAQNRLTTIQNMFMQNGAPTEDPRILFAIRNEIDDMLDSPDVGRARDPLREIRGLVDAELAAKVPGIKDADARWQEIARQEESFETGRSIFGQAQNAIDPRDFEVMLDDGVIPRGQFVGPSGETFALSQGARNELDRLIGTGTQNRTRLAGAVRGDGTWNREKLVQLYGEERADAIFNLFENEARMASTEQMAIGNSITALRQAAKQDLQPPTSDLPILEGPFLVNPGNIARRGIDAVTGGASRAAQERRNQQIAQALMQRGGWYENRMRSPGQLSLIRALLAGGGEREMSPTQ